MNKKALLVIFFTVFIDLIGFGIIIPLSPYLARKFGADALDVGLLMAIYSAMQFLFSPFWGQLSDRIGRRPVILISLIGAGLSYLGFAFADSLFMLYVARAFAGLFGANISTAMAYIADVTPKEERSKGMGLIGAAFGLGFVMGPFLGGFFGQVGKSLGEMPPFGENFPALIAAGICFSNVLLAFFVLKESLKSRAAEKRVSRWSRFAGAIKNPNLAALYGMFFLCSLAMANMEAASFLYVKDKFDWGLTKASYGFAYIGILMVFTQGYLVRKLLPKWGEKRTLITGMFLFCFGLTYIGFAENIWALAVAFTLLAFGNGFIHPSINGSISLAASAKEQGIVMGVNQSLASMGRIIGPILGGWLYRELHISSPFWAGGLLAVVAIFIFMMKKKGLPEGAKKEVPKKEDTAVVSQISIGLFQLKNLMNQDVPFLFYDIRLEKESFPVELEAVLNRSSWTAQEELVDLVQAQANSKDDAIVILCEKGDRSQKIGLELERLGFINVYVVEGGISGLKEEF